MLKRYGNQKSDRKTVLHRIAAVLTAAAVVFTCFFTEKVVVRSDSGTWEREPYEACFLMFNADPSDDAEENDGLMLAGQRSFFNNTLEILKAWQDGTNVDLTSDALWGPVLEWKRILSGAAPVCPEKFPLVGEGSLFNAWQEAWNRISSLAADIVGNAQAIRQEIEQFVSNAGDYEMYFDPVTGKNYYLRATTDCDETILNKFRTTAGNYGYCLNWNYKFPNGQPADDIRTGEELKRTLSVTDGQYNKLLNLLKLGFPTNNGLPGSFKDLPDEALRYGTQAAIWIYLCSIGASGNNGSGALTMEGMQDVTDPVLNPTSVTDLSSYVRYLLQTADESDASIPGAEVKDLQVSDLLQDGSYVITEVRITAANCSEYVRLSAAGFEGHPYLEAIDSGTQVTRAEDGYHLSGFSGLAETTHRYLLYLPTDGNTGKKVRITAAGVGKFTNTEMSIHWDENLFIDDEPTQIMSNIHINDYPVSLPCEAQVVLPYPTVSFFKADALTYVEPELPVMLMAADGNSGQDDGGTEGAQDNSGQDSAGTDGVQDSGGTDGNRDGELEGNAGLPGAKLHLETMDGAVAETVEGEELRWVSAAEETTFTGVYAGTYRLVEDEAPYGYLKREDEIIVVEDTAWHQSFTILNERPVGALSVEKTDKTDGKALAGAAFELFYAEDVSDRTGQTVFGKGEAALDEEGRTIGALVTDENGWASSDARIPIGLYDAQGFVREITYELRETKTPAGQYEPIAPKTLTFTYVDDETALIRTELSLQDPSPRLDFHKGAVLPTFVGRKELAKEEEITAVDPGDEVQYTLTLQNTGTAPARNILVRDRLPEGTEFIRWTAEGGDEVRLLSENDGTLCFFDGELAADETVTLTINVKIRETLHGKKEVLVNTAEYFLPDDPENVPDPEDTAVEWIPSEDVLYRVVPEPQYVFSAERITEASKSPDSDTFGFRREDLVYYRLNVENTGNLPLNMDLTVVPEEIAENVLTEVTYLSAAGEGLVWLNEETSVNTAVPPRISLEAGKKGEIIFTCRIGKDADAYTADAPADSKEDPLDGYRFLCCADHVNGTYEEKIFDPAHPENEVRVERIADGSSFAALLPQYDDINTPVRLLYGYTIQKERVTEAPEARQEPGKYGFRLGTAVQYRVVVRNTGEVKLKVEVEDRFEADCFEDLRFTAVEGDGVQWENGEAAKAGLENARLEILPGKEAALSIEATVGQQAKAYLADHARDEKEDPDDGYVNVAAARRAEAVFDTYVPENGVIVKKTVTKTQEDSALLKDRTDTANTPVQVIVGRVKGEQTEHKPSEPVVLGIDTAFERWLYAGLLTVFLFAAGAALRYLIRMKHSKKKEDK